MSSPSELRLSFFEYSGTKKRSLSRLRWFALVFIAPKTPATFNFLRIVPPARAGLALCARSIIKTILVSLVSLIVRDVWIAAIAAKAALPLNVRVVITGTFAPHLATARLHTVEEVGK